MSVTASFSFSSTSSEEIPFVFFPSLSGLPPFVRLFSLDEGTQILSSFCGYRLPPFVAPAWEALCVALLLSEDEVKNFSSFPPAPSLLLVQFCSLLSRPRELFFYPPYRTLTPYALHSPRSHSYEHRFCRAGAVVGRAGECSPFLFLDPLYLSAAPSR